MSDHVLIFDTTLRDGEQPPGNGMTRPARLRLARQLERLGVDVIEAGFPAASEVDFLAVADAAEALETPIVAALARCHPRDTELALDALRTARRPRLHVFLSTSDLHLERKLRIGRAEALDRIDATIRSARGHLDDIQFSCEDASRTDPEFLIEAIRVAIAAGATTINLPDTVGYALPTEYGAMFAMVRAALPDPEAIVLSAHCHDDLGLATANSLAAIAQGARQIECTINGIGERAGNAALEEVVMAMQVRAPLIGLSHGIRTRELARTSQLLTATTGVPPQPNKAIVGRNAFAHESGIHQHGMLRDRRTYEIMTPADVGMSPTRLVLGRHSGRAALAARYHELGWDFDEETIETAYAAFLEVAARVPEVHDEDLVALAHQSFRDVPSQYGLSYLAVECGRQPAHAVVRLTGPWVGERGGVGEGDGPIAAAFAAIAAVLERTIDVEELELRSLVPGREAVGHVVLRARIDGMVYTGQGHSTDIVEAGVRALIVALDKAAFATALRHDAMANTYLWGV